MHHVGMRRMLVLAILLVARAAHADTFHWQADLDLSARYATDAELDVHQTTGRVDLRGLAGVHHVGLAGGIDVELGFEVPAGFVYGFHLLPLGLGVRLWDRAALGVLAGAGVGGTIARLPFAWELPVQAFVELDLGGYVRLLGGARATWTGGRDAGAVDVGWTDEAELGLGLAFGARHDEYGTLWSDGTYVGVALCEQAGERFFGMVLAANLNGASR
jgi:hypothetical protein